MPAETVARSLSPIRNPDYVDYFTESIDGLPERSPEEWARAVLEGTATGRAAPMLWRFLGLRLGPRPSPDHVQGWKIAARGDDWIRLETSSWYMTGHAVVRTADGVLSLSLILRFDHPIARVIWPPVSIGHGRAVPAMLHQAVKRARG
jgi:hypothetical protein